MTTTKSMPLFSDRENKEEFSGLFGAWDQNLGCPIRNQTLTELCLKRVVFQYNVRPSKPSVITTTYYRTVE